MQAQAQMDKSWRDLVEIMHFTESVAAKIHGMLDEAQIYRTIKDEFAKSKRYTVSIALLTDDGSKLRVAQLSSPPRRLKATAKIVGMRLQEYRLDLLKSSIYRQVVREGKTVHVSVRDILRELFPPPLADLIVKGMGYEQRNSILTPLSRQGQIIGVLAMSSTALAEDFIPSVKNLALHISTALELADEGARRKRVEEAERQSEERYRTLCERLPVGLYRTTPGGQILEANLALVEMLGYPGLESLLTANAFDFYVHPEERRQWQSLMESGRVASGIKTQVWRHDGTVVWVRETSHAIRDAVGQVLFYEGILENITDRKRVEEALRASEERFRRMAEVIPVCFWMYSPDWERAIYISPGAEKIYGHTCESFYRQPGLWLDAVHPDDGERVRTFWEEHHEHEGESEYRIVRPDGEIRWVREVAAPVRNEAGELVLLTGFVEDITERKRTEAQLIQAEKLASLGVLAGGIAHQLRNPLGIISASAQLLQEHPDDPQLQSQCTEKIRAATQRASKVIENLLRFARGESAPMLEMDVQLVLEETFDLLAHHMTLRRVSLGKEFQPCLPCVHGNPHLLQQAFINLILNACNAMPQGGTLTVTTRATKAGGVEIQFRDTGHGIAPEHLSKIFDPFFTTMPLNKGTGLGLPVTWSIIQQHQGTIEVHSQVGQGATFTIRLPGRQQMVDGK